MQRMRDEPPVVQRDFTLLRAGDDIEIDAEGLPIRLQRLGAEYDVRGSFVSVGALQVRRRVAFNAEFGHVVFRGDLVGDGGENGHLNRI